MGTEGAQWPATKPDELSISRPHMMEGKNNLTLLNCHLTCGAQRETGRERDTEREVGGDRDTETERDRDTQNNLKILNSNNM